MERNRVETKSIMDAVDRASPVADLSEIKELCAKLCAEGRAQPSAELSELKVCRGQL